MMNISQYGIISQIKYSPLMKKSIWHKDYLTLREALKAMRKDNDLTQTKLAEKLDKPQSFIAKYENGDRNLDLLEIIKICEACNTSTEKFIKDLLKQLQN